METLTCKISFSINVYFKIAFQHLFLRSQNNYRKRYQGAKCGGFHSQQRGSHPREYDHNVGVHRKKTISKLCPILNTLLINTFVYNNINIKNG